MSVSVLQFIHVNYLLGLGLIRIKLLGLGLIRIKLLGLGLIRIK